MNGLITLAALILVGVSGLHFYWAFGGKWGGSAALPEKEGGGVLFRPRTAETLAVAVLLLGVCYVLVAQAELLPALPPNRWAKWGCMLCAAVFFGRAVGDLKYLGFFKKVRHSAFARLDTRVYSPLCLFLALSFAVVLSSNG